MAIEDRDLARLKEIFVTRRECQETTESFERKMNKDSVRMAIIETELRQIKWLVGLVLAGTIANLVNSVFTMI